MGITSNKQFRSFALIAASINFITGLLVIVGWILKTRAITHIKGDYISMKFNTALCVCFMGAALFFRLVRGVRKYKGLAYFFTSLSFLIALISFCEYLFGIDAYIDTLFYADSETVAIPHPQGRITPLTCLSIAVISAGIFFSGYYRAARVMQYMLHLITLITFIALMGYVFNIKALHSHSFPTSIALHSAVTMFLLSIGVALLNPELGLVRLFTGKLIGNLMAKQLFTRIVIAVVIVVYLFILTYRNNVMSVELAAVFYAIVLLFAMLLFINDASKALNKIELDRKLAEDRFQLVVESAPNALIISDTKGDILLANRQAKLTFGYSEDEMIGKKIEMLIPRNIRDYHPDIRNSFFQHPQKRSFTTLHDIYAVRKDGTEFPVEIGLTPINTDKGIVALSSIVDVTERKQNERIIRKQMKELKMKNNEMERFTYIASHDLQEPLRTVSNYIQFLQEDYPEIMNEEIKQHLSTIGSAVERMGILVRSLLDYGRLGQNKVLATTDCAQLLQEVVSDLNSLITTSGATIVIQPLPVIDCYRMELRQVFQNLINNAVKFRKKDVAPLVTISHRVVGEAYEFAVSDNGIGIERQHFDRIFLMFQRLHRQDDYQGYGVGLANCNKIVNFHGGRLWVESVPGEGSTFKFLIPFIKNES